MNASRPPLTRRERRPPRSMRAVSSRVVSSPVAPVRGRFFVVAMRPRMSRRRRDFHAGGGRARSRRRGARTALEHRDCRGVRDRVLDRSDDSPFVSRRCFVVRRTLRRCDRTWFERHRRTGGGALNGRRCSRDPAIARVGDALVFCRDGARCGAAALVSAAASPHASIAGRTEGLGQRGPSGVSSAVSSTSSGAGPVGSKRIRVRGRIGGEAIVRAATLVRKSLTGPSRDRRSGAPA